jgi:CO dehydrogenase/acetyl-CoA synthase gamma subunit (corrinoid Fe-S protein)
MAKSHRRLNNMTNNNDELTVQTITDEIERIDELLAKLQYEFADFQNRMTIAATDGDSASMISLQKRQADLPLEIKATEILVLNLRLQRLEMQKPTLVAARQATHEPLQQAIIERDNAINQFNILSANAANAHENVRQNSLEIGELTRERDRHIFQTKTASR